VRGLVLAGGLALLTVVGAVVFLWPAGSGGPEPIRWGRDTCAECRMHLSQPGFAAEMRAPGGALTKYDDVGCLLRAMLQARAGTPEAWVEDHGGGGFVPLLGAHLVRAASAGTPMGYGIVAFADQAAARAFAAAHAGEPVRLEDVMRDPSRLARAAAGEVQP